MHHYSHHTLVVLVLFTVPFYHFSFSRYLELAEHHFSSDILVPFPDSEVLYSRGYLSINKQWKIVGYRDTSDVAKRGAEVAEKKEQ